MIKIDFEFSQDGMTFRDAIVLPDDHGMSDADIEALKQKRFNDWLAVIKTAAEAEPQE